MNIVLSIDKNDTIKTDLESRFDITKPFLLVSNCTQRVVAHIVSDDLRLYLEKKTGETLLGEPLWVSADSGDQSNKYAMLEKAFRLTLFELVKQLRQTAEQVQEEEAASFKRTVTVIPPVARITLPSLITEGQHD